MYFDDRLRFLWFLNTDSTIKCYFKGRTKFGWHLKNNDLNYSISQYKGIFGILQDKSKE